MLRKGFYVFLILGVIQTAQAQDTLPDITVKLLGKKALISWTNPFENITSISIQRSGDSVRNFKSIGSVFNVATRSNGFVDHKEFLPNEQYYRLFITFEGGDYLFTKAYQPVLDTSAIAPAVAEVIEKAEEEKPFVKPLNHFMPSQYVYTGKDRNVILSLPDAEHKKYRVRFYEDDGTFLFELKKIPESLLIVDKANFNHSGLFRFELYENGVLKEIHKVFIPKPGKPVPLLDVNGYEIRK